MIRHTIAGVLYFIGILIAFFGFISMNPYDIICFVVLGLFVAFIGKIVDPNLDVIEKEKS